MAATFTVETGGGLAAANSYLSVAAADDYHLNHSASTAWSGASQADKEKALRLATQYLDARYNGKWKGSRANEGQALDWPRANVMDNDGYYYLSTGLPLRLEDAIAELALKVINGDTLLEDLDSPGTVSSESVSIGPISESKTYIGGQTPVKKYALVDNLMRPLLEDNTTCFRG